MPMRLPRRSWIYGLAATAAIVIVLGTLVRTEMRSSAWQARMLSRYAADMTATLQPGADPAMTVPREGPYNQRLGYSWLPNFIKSLTSSGFDVMWQARPSDAFKDFVKRGGFPIYRAKTSGGLTIFDRQGQLMHQARFPQRSFDAFESVPPLLVETLTFIENRELFKEGPVTRNPAIEWDRFALAVLGHGIGAILPGLNLGGGSTLATQIEKFRHSPGGQTQGGMDKLRQIASASLRAYLDGPDTRMARRRILLDYLNATPLSARPGWGEVNGIGDGLWAWFGIDLAHVTAALNAGETPDQIGRKAEIYKHCLALILAQRRPSYYLGNNRAALEELTNATLARLEDQRIISPTLRAAATETKLHFLKDPPAWEQSDFVVQKASNAMRRYLLNMLGLNSLYELDRFDLTVGSTLDMPTQQAVAEFLSKLRERRFVEQIGLQGFRMLGPDSDPSKINWTIILFERTPRGNELRVQADNLEQPLDLNDGAKLDLGSTAKLRTLVTYLQIIADLHLRYGDLDNASLRTMAAEAPDQLTAWALDWLQAQEDRSLSAMLDAAMARPYSASPRETFFTGGGAHTFNNFEHNDDHKAVTLDEAFRKSINLPFIRLMRDIVNHITAQGPRQKSEILGDPDHPARKAYLERFADGEGSVFLNKFFATYGKLDADDALRHLARGGRKSPTALVVMFRSVVPDGTAGDFITWFRKLQPQSNMRDGALTKLFDAYPTSRYNLADRGYIAGVNPLELWLVGWRRANPNASRRAMLTASRQERLDTYAWLFHTKYKSAQDNRIRILLEQDAFASLQESWARLGYPFERLIPSLATAIGSSADRPGALAELMGIILNDGVRMPSTRANFINFAMNTPYQTMLKRQDTQGEMVLHPDIARRLRVALTDVAQNGTAKRVWGAFTDPVTGLPVIMGGKTGTGDHRFDEFGPGGRLVSSRVVNRTATFTFFIGDRFFGTITAYVAGPEAAKYSFTSALPSQMLRALAPTLSPLLQTKAAPSDPLPQP